MKTNFNKNSHFFQKKNKSLILWFLSGTEFLLKFRISDSLTFYCTNTILQHSNEWNKIALSFYCSSICYSIWRNQHLLSLTNVVSSERKVINHIKFQFRLIFSSLTFALIINTNGNLHDIKFNACHKPNILNLQYFNVKQIPLASKRSPSDDPKSRICWLCVMDVNCK